MTNAVQKFLTENKIGKINTKDYVCAIEKCAKGSSVQDAGEANHYLLECGVITLKQHSAAAQKLVDMYLK